MDMVDRTALSDLQVQLEFHWLRYFQVDCIDDGWVQLLNKKLYLFHHSNDWTQMNESTNILR